MQLTAHYDTELSKLSEKLAFYCGKYELCSEDLDELKKKKLIKLVEWEGLPKTVPCQVLIYCETVVKAKVIFFNTTFVLPEACYDEPMLNKDLIEWSKKSGGFWIEFIVPLTDKMLHLDFSIET